MYENECFEFAAQPMSNYTAGWVEPRRIYIMTVMKRRKR